MIELHEGLEIREIPGEPGFFAREDGTIWTEWIGPSRGFTHRGKAKKNWIRDDELLSIKPSTGHCGHLHVSVFTCQRPVHTLILEAFVGQRPDGFQARHFPDPSPSNNDVRNLSWASVSTNQRDRITHGTARIESWRKIYTEDDALDMLEEWTNGMTIAALAVKYAISQQRVRRMLDL